MSGSTPGLAPIVERMVFETNERASSIHGMEYVGLTTRPRCRGCNQARSYTCKEIVRPGSVFPRSGQNQPRVPIRITPVPFHCLAYTCWVCEDTDEFYKPRICVCRRYIRDSASVPVEKAIQRDWPPSRKRRRRSSEPEMPQSFEETRPRLPRLYDRVNLIESADIKSCPGCNNGARQSICRGMPMRMSEEDE